MTDIVIRSYHRDAPWVSLAMRSIARFVSGYRQTVVVLPRSSTERMDLQSSQAAIVVGCADFYDDYLGQQITKLHADLYSDADVILHIDSDQIFMAPCALEARLFENGRLRMTYGATSGRPPSDGWRRCIGEFFGATGLPDLATPLPLAVPRHLYRALRDECLERHEIPIAQYALNAGADRFSECALLRAWAYLHERDGYEWVEGPLLPECRTFWSRAESPGTAAAALAAALGTQ